MKTNNKIKEIEKLKEIENLKDEFININLDRLEEMKDEDLEFGLFCYEHGKKQFQKEIKKLQEELKDRFGGGPTGEVDEEYIDKIFKKRFGDFKWI